MSKRNDIHRCIFTTIRHLGRLDVVISNKGWTSMRNFAYLDDNMIESKWDTCFNINAKSRLHLFHAVRSYLIATKGALVSVASLAGVIPSGSSIVRRTYSCRTVLWKLSVRLIAIKMK